MGRYWVKLVTLVKMAYLRWRYRKISDFDKMNRAERRRYIFKLAKVYTKRLNPSYSRKQRKSMAIAKAKADVARMAWIKHSLQKRKGGVKTG